MGLDEFDVEGEQRAELPEVPATKTGLQLFAPEQELRAFPVIEQYEPREPADPEHIDSVRPLSSRWMRARSAALAGVVLLVAGSSGLPVVTLVLPERLATYPQARPVSTAEARLSPAISAIASPPARRPEPVQPARPRPKSRQVSSRPADTLPVLQLDEVRRAYATLVSQDEPFEDCAARVAAVDRVVVRCQGRRGEWTLDFNRALDRWQIVGEPDR